MKRGREKKKVCVNACSQERSCIKGGTPDFTWGEKELAWEKIALSLESGDLTWLLSSGASNSHP